eukprot:3439923-Rhodomonas_salina.1
MNLNLPKNGATEQGNAARGGLGLRGDLGGVVNRGRVTAWGTAAAAFDMLRPAGVLSLLLLLLVEYPCLCEINEAERLPAEEHGQKIRCGLAGTAVCLGAHKAMLGTDIAHCGRRCKRMLCEQKILFLKGSFGKSRGWGRIWTPND